MSDSEVHVFAKIVAQEDKADEVRDVLTELVTHVRKEMGVKKYVLHEDTQRPGAFLLSESYENQAMVDAHMKSAALAHAFSTVKSMLLSRPEVHVMKAIDV